MTSYAEILSVATKSKAPFRISVLVPDLLMYSSSKTWLGGTSYISLTFPLETNFSVAGREVCKSGGGGRGGSICLVRSLGTRIR